MQGPRARLRRRALRKATPLWATPLQALLQQKPPALLLLSASAAHSALRSRATASKMSPREPFVWSASFTTPHPPLQTE